MSRARDIANLGSTPPLTASLGTTFITVGSVSSVAPSSNSVVIPSSDVSIVMPGEDYLQVTLYTPLPSFFTDISDGTLNITLMGDQYSFSVSGVNYVLPIQNTIEWAGSWNGLPPPGMFFTFDDSTWSRSSTSITSSSGSIATALSGTSEFLIGSTIFETANVTMSGATITLAGEVQGISAGDSIGYWDTPIGLTGKSQGGESSTLRFNSSGNLWEIDSTPVSFVREVPLDTFTNGETTTVSIDRTSNGYFTTPEFTINRPDTTTSILFTYQFNVEISVGCGASANYEAALEYFDVASNAWVQQLTGLNRLAFTNNTFCKDSIPTQDVVVSSTPDLRIRWKMYKGTTTASGRVKFVIRRLRAFELGTPV